ncbi:MAG: 4Fe-4S dicluster domain-containing protein, partial [Chloroflexi bacterium]|nr:4Fe-4S dicluster domain-containing protein [Chloroflexota bacterium]
MRFTTTKELQAWLDRLAQETDLIAPRDVDGHVLYRPVASGDEVLLDYERPELSAKTYLLPDTEVLLRFERRGNDVTQEEVLPDRQQVIFGLRPCDAHGFVAIDALFLEQDPADAYYRHHRERTTLVGLACPRMWEGCFCTSVGGAPDDPTHLDVLLREVDGGYAVEVVTEKGEALLEGTALSGVEGLALEEREGEPAPSVADAEQVVVTEPEKWRTLFEDQMWMRHGERCLSCRICTYVCPTCRCFDVTDRVTGVKDGATRIERIRVWDACTSTNYRRAAGGHNSRPTKPGRLRNRFYCKFCYYPEDFGPLGCVGCGRCIVSCPVDIDITEVM